MPAAEPAANPERGLKTGRLQGRHRNGCNARDVRGAAAIVVTAGVPLHAAACGGAPGSHVAQLGATTTETGVAPLNTSTTSTEQEAVAFARCMRSHRAPNWPDPESNGRFDKTKLTLQQFGVEASRLHAGQTACDHLLPNGGQPPNQARLRQARAQVVRFSRCMRSLSVPGFPDSDSTGRIPDPATVGVDQGSPAFQAANQAGRRYRPPYIPSNSAYDSWARTRAGSGS